MYIKTSVKSPPRKSVTFSSQQYQDLLQRCLQVQMNRQGRRRLAIRTQRNRQLSLEAHRPLLYLVALCLKQNHQPPVLHRVAHWTILQSLGRQHHQCLRTMRPLISLNRRHLAGFSRTSRTTSTFLTQQPFRRWQTVPLSVPQSPKAQVYSLRPSIRASHLASPPLMEGMGRPTIACHMFSVPFRPSPLTAKHQRFKRPTSPSLWSSPFL